MPNSKQPPSVFGHASAVLRDTVGVCAGRVCSCHDGVRATPRTPDHQRGTLDVSRCMQNCAPGDRARIQTVSSVGWFGLTCNLGSA